MTKAYDSEGNEYDVIGSNARPVDKNYQINQTWIKSLKYAGIGLGTVALLNILVAKPQPTTPPVVINNNITNTTNMPPKQCGLLSFLIGC